MVMQLMKSGYLVYGSDISSGADFLAHDDVECDWIITNPPFSLSEEFVRRCWDICKELEQQALACEVGRDHYLAQEKTKNKEVK